MARVKTFTNGGTLLAADLNSIQDDYENAFSTYETLVDMVSTAATIPSSTNPGTYEMPGNGLAMPGTNSSANGAFYVDPADRTAGSRANKWRVRAICNANTSAPGANFVVGLYPILTWGSGGAGQPTLASLGAVVTGSTVTFTTPASFSATQGLSGDFTAPAAGFYVFGVTVSTTVAVGSQTLFHAELQARRV